MLSSFGTSGTVKMELQCLSSIEIPDSSRFTRKFFVVFHGKRVKLEFVNNFCLHQRLQVAKHADGAAQRLRGVGGGLQGLSLDWDHFLYPGSMYSIFTYIYRKN